MGLPLTKLQLREYGKKLLKLIDNAPPGYLSGMTPEPPIGDPWGQHVRSSFGPENRPMFLQAKPNRRDQAFVVGACPRERITYARLLSECLTTDFAIFVEAAVKALSDPAVIKKVRPPLEAVLTPLKKGLPHLTCQHCREPLKTREEVQDHLDLGHFDFEEGGKR